MVHIYPICSAFYILSQEGFNDVGLGFCFLSASPSYCWIDTSIPCERGPQSQLMDLLWYVPLWIVLILPSIIMSILFVKVRKSQETIFIHATSIAKQTVRIRVNSFVCVYVSVFLFRCICVHVYIYVYVCACAYILCSLSEFILFLSFCF